MRIPISWLRDYVAVEMPLAELADRLSVSPAEVEGVERRGVPDTDGNLGLFRVGRVVEAGKHPNADRLQLCQVDVGEGEPRQIVCGAWNFGAGATVAVALPGTPLADAAPIRDVVLDTTPTLNRVDLLSVYGLAREVAALSGGELRPMPGIDPAITHPEWVDVQIEDKEGCPRYIARVFRDVHVRPSP